MSHSGSLGLLTDPLEEVIIFGVSRRVPTNLHDEVMIFGVTQGVPTDIIDF